jgi:hypothetical protein
LVFAVQAVHQNLEAGISNLDSAQSATDQALAGVVEIPKMFLPYCFSRFKGGLTGSVETLDQAAGYPGELCRSSFQRTLRLVGLPGSRQ